MDYSLHFVSVFLWKLYFHLQILKILVKELLEITDVSCVLSYLFEQIFPMQLKKTE